jgi:hypothetical protein
VFTHLPTRASTRVNRSWSQEGPKLTGGGAVGNGEFGSSVALSADGNAALVGGTFDNRLGSAWVFTRTGSRSVPTTRAQQGER